MADLQRILEMFKSFFSPAGQLTTFGTRYFFTDADNKKSLAICDSDGNILSTGEWDIQIDGNDILFTIGEKKYAITAYDPDTLCLDLELHGQVYEFYRIVSNLDTTKEFIVRR
jgi:hypothetical protein